MSNPVLTSGLVVVAVGVGLLFGDPVGVLPSASSSSVSD